MKADSESQSKASAKLSNRGKRAGSNTIGLPWVTPKSSKPIDYFNIETYGDQMGSPI